MKLFLITLFLLFGLLPGQSQTPGVEYDFYLADTNTDYEALMNEPVEIVSLVSGVTPAILAEAHTSIVTFCHFGQDYPSFEYQISTADLEYANLIMDDPISPDIEGWNVFSYCYSTSALLPTQNTLEIIESITSPLSGGYFILVYQFHDREPVLVLTPRERPPHLRR